jgi:hypothetical protein
MQPERRISHPTLQPGGKRFGLTGNEIQKIIGVACNYLYCRDILKPPELNESIVRPARDTSFTVGQAKGPRLAPGGH